MDTAEARTTTSGEAGGPVYDAFLSYSHAADDLLAPRLQSGLQRFAKPWWKRRALRVFRDEASLSANPHLWSSITEALDESGWFVLLLSPDAAKSPWVNREVEYWLEHKEASRILPVVTDGSFVWAEGELSSATDAAPPALHGAFSEEPRWVDLRFARTEEQLDLKNPRFSAAVADVASAVRGVPKDELESEEVRQHRRTTRTAWAAGIAVLLFAIVAAAAALFALDQRNEAEAAATAEAEQRAEADGQRQIAQEQTEIAQENERQAQKLAQIARARELAAGSLLNLDDDPERSILLALEAVNTAGASDGTVVSEPVTALHQALAASRAVLRVPGGELVDYSPDGSLLATALGDDAAIWDAETGQQSRVLPSPDGRKARLAAFSPDGRSLAVGYGDAGASGPLVVLWEVSTGEVIATFDDPGLAEAGVVGFSPDGELLAAETSGESAAPMVVWEVASGTERYRIDHGEGQWVGGPSFSPDGKLLAVIGSAGAMLHDAATGEELISLDVPADWSLHATAFDPDGRSVAAVSQFPPGVVIWDVDSGEIESFWEAEGGPATIEWSPSGQLVAISGNTPTPRLYDTATGEEVLSLLGQASVIHSIAFSPTGDRLAGAGIASDTLIWDVRPSVRREVATVETPYPGLEWIAYSADGDSILVLSDEEGTSGTVARIDPDTGEVLATIPDQMSDFPFNALLAPEAGLVTSLNSDGSAAFHDSRTFEPTVSLPDGQYAMAVSPDGTRALLNRSASVGAPVVAEVGSWEVLATLEEGFVWWAYFSPSGDLATAWSVGQEEGWLIDIPTGSVLASFAETNVPERFSPDGSLLLVHTFTGGLKLLDVAALEAGTAPQHAVVWEITAHTGMAPQAFFSPDGSLIASLGGDSQLRVWDTQNGELVADFGGFGGSFPGHYFHPDGKHLIAEDAGGTIQVLTLDSNELVDIATSRLTRGFTEDECTTYRIDPCPTLEQIQNG